MAAENGMKTTPADGLVQSSSTTSLRPSIYEHVEEYGRTYHSYKSGSKRQPSPNPELPRHPIQHAREC
jgi:hypothetical protein